ncbi:MAG: D-alanyl-D-alanine carboxypeptidase/D-alanyl-D-alanine endopeptidase [Gemmatimonadaceae bacterium]
MTDTSAMRRLRNLAVAFDSTTGGYIVKGTMAAGDSSVFTVAHRDPARAYISALREALVERGITIGGAIGDTSGVADTLFTVWSPPLREILPAFQKPSQNQIGEVLLRTLGRERTSVGSADSGRAVIERQLAEWRVEPDGYAVRDGSGLSRHNYLTPETIIRVLDAMRRHPAFPVFYEALPIAGVDGTIATRMRGTPAAGNLRAKTGTLDRARSLSGYVTAADGRMLIFSLLCNNYTSVTDVTRVQDSIGARLAGLRLGGSGA